MVQRILVAVDGSESSDKALEYAARTAKAEKADLTILAVVEPEHPKVHTLPADETPSYDEKERERLKQVLKDDAQKVKAKSASVQVEMKLMFGIPVEEISRECREGEYNLVVVGSRGISGIKGIILGSVSKGVADTAPCPVLIVK